MLRRIAPEFVIDVGANRGQFTLDVVIAVPTARVIAFEPLPTEAAVFSRIFKSYPNVQLRSHALGSTSERREMHISEAADSSSLYDFTSLQESLYPGTAESGQVGVDVLTLDDALDGTDIPPNSLLKADVQGYELEVLRGCDRVLPLFKWVYLEVSFVELYVGQPLASELIGYLSDRKFKVADTSEPSRVAGQTIQIDLLFENHVSA